MAKLNITITTTTCWPMAARLALEFRNLGARVSAICPAASPLRAVTGISVTTYPRFSPIEPLATALWTTKPDLIIPCDDRAVAHLHEIQAADPGNPLPIERSLGDRAGYTIASQRGPSMMTAAEQDILEPNTRVLKTRLDVVNWWKGRTSGVIKCDGTWGGNGVAIVKDVTSAMAAFDRMNNPPLARQVIRAAVFESDPYSLRGWFRREQPGVIGQDFVDGYQANVMAACWRGEVLGIAGVTVLETTKQFGVSSIVRPTVTPEMRIAATCMVRRLGMSGFCGIDFVVDRETHRPYMIELNPRPTQIGHLPLLEGESLAGVLFRHLSGEGGTPIHAPLRQETIALFPQAWSTPTLSRQALTAYQDIPWEEPSLLACLLRRMGDGRAFRQRLTDRIMGRRTPGRLLAEFNARQEMLSDT